MQGSYYIIFGLVSVAHHFDKTGEMARMTTVFVLGYEQL